MYANRATYVGLIALLALGAFSDAPVDRFRLELASLLGLDTGAGDDRASNVVAATLPPMQGSSRPARATLRESAIADAGQPSLASVSTSRQEDDAMPPAPASSAGTVSRGTAWARTAHATPEAWPGDTLVIVDDAVAWQTGPPLPAVDEDTVRWLQSLGQVLYGDSDVEARIEALRLLAADAGPAASALVRAALADPDESVRWVAEALAATLPAPVEPDAAPGPGHYSLLDDMTAAHGIDPITARLRDPLAIERLAAIDEVYFLEVETAARLLGEVLERDADPLVREQALAALDLIDGEEAVQAISGALGDHDVNIREQAVQVLWNAGSQSVPLLGQALFGDPEPALRTRVVHLLAADGSPAAIALLEAATDDPDEGVRRTARRMLGR